MSRSEGQPLLGSINQAMPVAVAGGESNLFSSVVNLTNTILGAGLLAIPFAFRLSGLGLGLGFLAFIWLASALSFDVLGRAAQLTGLYTYKEIAARSCGKPLAIISELCILLYTFLSLVSRPIILSQYLVTVFASWTSPNDPAGVPFILTQRWFFITVVLVIIYPLTFLRNIDALKYSSFFSLVCVLFAAIVVFIMFGETPGMEERLRDIQFVPDSWSSLASSLISLGIMVVSFCAHYNAPRMYQELQSRSMGRWRVVVMVSSGLCFIAYASVGVLGYMTCLDFTADNVLDDYAQSIVLVTVARLALCIAIVFSTPLVLFACRRAFLAVFLPSKAANPPFWLWITVSGSMLLIAGIIAFVLPSISVIFGFSGAIVGVSFIFFIPGLFFILLGRTMASNSSMRILNETDFTEPEAPVSSKTLIVTGSILIGFACLLCPLGTTGAVFRLITEHDSPIPCFNVTWKAATFLMNEL